MALSMLQPLNPTSRAATKLGDGGPSALEVAYKRKGMEMDLGKALQKAEADKVKVKVEQDKLKAEQQKQLELLPSVANMPHTQVFAKAYNDGVGEIGQIIKRNGGSIPEAGTPDWDRFMALKQGILQLENNSKQINTEKLRQLAAIDANPNKFLPGARQEVESIYSDPKWLTSQSMPENAMLDYFDVNGYLATLFGKITPDQTAYAAPTAEGGVTSGTRKFTVHDDIKKTAEMGAADDLAAGALRRQFEKFSPEKQAFIIKLAEDNGMSRDAAMALELGVGLQEYTQRTAERTAPNESGYGQKVDEAGAINFIEKGIGMNDPSNKGKSFAEMGMKGDFETVRTFLNANPDLERFSVSIPRDAEVFNGYNGMIYKQTKDTEGKEHNRYVAGIARDPVTGKTQIVTTDANGGDVEVSKPIASERFYSEVMDPLAEYNPELDHKKVGYVYQKKYGPIQGQEGNIPLPRKGGALDLEAGELD